MSIQKKYIASTLGNDPHTEGIHNAMKIANLAGVEGFCVPPSESFDGLCKAIKENNPEYIGLSYRLSPKIGIDLLEKVINYFVNTGLINKDQNVKISFSGLPETIELAKSIAGRLPLDVYLVPSFPDVMDRAVNTLDYFGGGEDRDYLISVLKDELVPVGISMLDELADEIVRNDDYKNEPSLELPSDKAKKDFIDRIDNSPIPLLRSHFGIPAKTILPTVEGIKQLAEACVLDEVSLGSSDLSQRYFGQPEMFDVLKNDGGVPYKTKEDLALLFDATRRGNFPSLKPYCHVKDIVPFIHTCIESGLLVGAHQAIPLYWFNELDKRGPHSIEESIYEHFAGVKELVRMGIPVEMNDPNQWSSRNAHDTIIVTSYALTAAVMTMCGVDHIISQMQFNKPKETGDFADLAKMRAGKRIMENLSSYRINAPKIHIETRTGIESLSPDMNKAKWQLGRSTLLQMMMGPDVIHIVSYCEANYAAQPADIIDSSKLIRRGVRIFNKYKKDILENLNNPIIQEREQYLYDESLYLLNAIAQCVPVSYKNVSSLTPLVGNPEAIIRAIKSGIMTAPGIVNDKYKGHFITKPMKYGMINLVDEYVNPKILKESQRIKLYV